MMKKNGLYIAFGFVLATMAACTDEVPGSMAADDAASRIYLSAGVGGRTVVSRTPYYPTDDNGTALESPTVTHPLNVSVWASTDSCVFADKNIDGSDGIVSIHTTAHFQSGSPQLLGEAIYPKSDESDAGTTVYFVGLHPQSKDGSSWTPSQNNGDASYIFTGKEDVMFAPQISGTYGTAYEQSPTFVFHHLLTWLRVEIVADMDEADVQKKEAVANAWGKIKNLTVTSKNVVTVKSLGSTNFAQGNVTFDGTEIQMPLYQTGTDNVFPGSEAYPIPTKLTEVAYVLCAPVQGVEKEYSSEEGKDVPMPEYTLHLETESRTMDIPIDLKVKDATTNALSAFTGYTMGKQFIILLNFKMGNVISMSSDIVVGGDSDWRTDGTGSYDLGEEDLKDE